MLKQLVVWNQGDPQEWLLTVRHEGFHQYLDRCTDHAPHWFNEGSAEYFASAESSASSFKEGQINPMRRGTLRAAQKLLPLSQLLQLSARAFMADDVDLHYAQSWALVHFLRNTTPENEALYLRFFQGFQQDRPWASVQDEILKDVDLAALQRDYEAHIRAVLLAEK